jgi:hypothetical protein
MKLQTASRFNTYKGSVPIQVDNFTPQHGINGSRTREAYNDISEGFVAEKIHKSRMSLGANHLFS